MVRTDILREDSLDSAFSLSWLLWKTPEVENSEPREVSAFNRLLVLPRQNLVGTGLWLLLKCQYSKACSVKQIFGIRSLNDTDFGGVGFFFFLNSGKLMIYLTRYTVKEIWQKLFS